MNLPNQERCVRSPVSSRVCELGTRTCIVANHSTMEQADELAEAMVRHAEKDEEKKVEAHSTMEGWEIEFEWLLKQFISAVSLYDLHREKGPVSLRLAEAHQKTVEELVLKMKGLFAKERESAEAREYKLLRDIERLVMERESAERRVFQAMEDCRSETLFGDPDSNEVMIVTIENFIEAVKKEAARKDTDVTKDV